MLGMIDDPVEMNVKPKIGAMCCHNRCVFRSNGNSCEVL